MIQDDKLMFTTKRLSDLFENKGRFTIDKCLFVPNPPILFVPNPSISLLHFIPCYLSAKSKGCWAKTNIKIDEEKPTVQNIVDALKSLE